MNEAARAELAVLDGIVDATAEDALDADPVSVAVMLRALDLRARILGVPPPSMPSGQVPISVVVAALRAYLGVPTPVCG